ncbi:hypothetical protein BDW22DRAFT_1352033 [Trametopsis cervina]|nr:hypothetical protein BDW22DRAFT_1352033 [Trametopsis cervina]
MTHTVLPVLLLLLGSTAHTALALPTDPQIPLTLPAPTNPESRPRKLHGRFLHLTDMHPDPFYRAGASEKSACHRNKPKKAKPRAGDFGFLYGECDSPLILTNYTLDYLEKNWADEVDFVVWTGDSARHDNDRKLPRTLKEIYQLNRGMVSRMEEIFTRRGIPVIPSIGNNDVWPHNIMLPGPNDVTAEFSSIWKSFVPFHSYQVFQRGAYYSVEVIPDSLAVVSLNTMYFFDSNKAVGGCDPKDAEDPGNLQLDWLEVQLAQFRSRGVQVWLTGHVPPSERNYHKECHIRYVELSLRYQDSILGHLFGHMNADHFFLLDATNLHPGAHAVEIQGAASDLRNADTDAARSSPSNDNDTTVVVAGKHKELYTTLLKDFNAVSKRSGKKLDYDALAVVNVSPSVVPNPYLPSFRVYAYNVSGDAYVPAAEEQEQGETWHRLGGLPGGGEGDEHGFGEDYEEEEDDWEEEVDEELRDAFAREDRTTVSRHLGDYVDREEWCPPGRENATWACTLSERWHSSPRSPSRTNRLLTPLGFAQYYLPDMNGTAKHPPQWRLEYLTFAPPNLHPPSAATTGTATDDAATVRFAYPIPLKHLPKKLRDASANVTKSKYAPYGMEDLTIPSWLRLVRRLGRAKHAKLRRRFKQYMYMGADQEL